ncbi:MAG: ATP-binding protein, partial [Nitrosopumilaceae archaeon]|nr:ATP-binding protein [Nitrosopumilaceae archaeon]
YTQRDNYNILLLATSGAGKSVTAKVILSRLMKKYPDCLVYIIDPQGEYDSITQYLDILPIRVTQQKELGFDPFKLFESNDAAEILGDITRAKDTVRKEFRALASKAKSVFDLYEIVSDEAKQYLKDLVEGHISDILKGDSTKMSERAVISLRGTYGQDESVAMLLLLALGKIWKKILEKPPRTPKILLIDEGWMLFKMPSAGKFLDSIARIGRKLNVIFIFVTQRPEDIIDNEYGRGIADNAGTKILLQNTEQASQKIAKAMSLSPQEMDMLKTFSRGEALFLTKDYRLGIQITPSREELKIFSTTPMENI